MNFSILVLLLFVVERTVLAVNSNIVLNDVRVYKPRFLTCDSDEYGFITFECNIIRSSGCNLDTRHCVLSPFVGYTNNTGFVSFNVVTFATSRGLNDGRINVQLSYSGKNEFEYEIELEGVLQLWKFTDQDENGANIYDFVGDVDVVYANSIQLPQEFGGTEVRIPIS
jgi:hypothetical protein